MFGYVIADMPLLSKEDAKIYRGAYCGLCHTLAKRFGSAARLTLNYDMTFLALLLSSVYGVSFENGEKRCAAHPAKKQPVMQNEITDYAADMNILLTYKNAVDNWQDDKSVPSLLASKIMSPSCKTLFAKYPRQSAAIDACLARLSETERRGDPDPDAAAGAFGELLSEVFIWQEDAMSPRLRRFGYALGCAVYMMDAAVDLRGDLKRQRYNPLAFVSCDRESLLDVLMARCTEAYGELCIHNYKSIFDNILYSGIWTRYRYRFAKEGANGKRSV